jgi:16S rRNA (guanine527-N7)-methyltransferase
MDILKKYFPHLTEKQLKQFQTLENLYKDWNSKINVISRKDIDNLYLHHFLHSLGITKMVHFSDNSSIMDIGTGGGLPGIPLAIRFPSVKFHLVDRTGKKIKVAQAIADSLELRNVTTRQCRIEEEKETFDFVVSRGVMPLPDMVKIVRKNISKTQRNAIANGLICLKGGNTDGETHPFRTRLFTENLKNHFSEDFFDTKKIIYLPL